MPDLSFLVLSLLVPTAHRLYNAACALAVYAETAHDPRPLERPI